MKACFQESGLAFSCIGEANATEEGEAREVACAGLEYIHLVDLDHIISPEGCPIF